MFNILKKITTIYSEEGLNGFARRLIRLFYVQEFAYKINIHNSPHAVYTLNKEIASGLSTNDFRFVELNSEFLSRMASEYPDEINKIKTESLEKKLSLQSTDKCYLVLSKNDVCGYYHIAFEENLDPLVNYKIINKYRLVYL